jgi:uncharacterized membrane protein YfcA
MSSDTQGKIFLFLERLWLVAAILGIGLVIYFLIVKDNDSALFFFGFFVLSGLLYLLRKRQRMRYQNFKDGKMPPYVPGKKK